VRRLLRVAEEEPVLVILLVGFAVVFLSVFPPRLPRSRMRCGKEAAEIRVAAPALHEQRHMSTYPRSGAGKAGTCAGWLRRAYATVQRDLGAGDRPHAKELRRVRELERAVDAVVVGERERLVPELGRARGELFRLRRPVQE